MYFLLHLQKSLKYITVYFAIFFAMRKCYFSVFLSYSNLYTNNKWRKLKDLAVKGGARIAANSKSWKSISITKPHMGINVIYSDDETLEYIYEDNHEYFIDNKGGVIQE